MLVIASVAVFFVGYTKMHLSICIFKIIMIIIIFTGFAVDASRMKTAKECDKNVFRTLRSSERWLAQRESIIYNLLYQIQLPPN